MQEDATKTDATDQDKGQAEPQQDEAKEVETSTEEQPKESVEKPTEETTEGEAQETSEEETAEDDSVDIENYWKERYSPETSQEPLKEESQSLIDRLGNLPTDEYGNADANEVAKVIENWQQETEASSVSKATQTARQEALALFNEQAQIQQVVKDYPQVAKNREDMDAIFDLRDASALRGKEITLKQAAQRWFDRVQKERKDAATQATRTKEIQASSYLESSSVSSDTQSITKQQLAAQAVGNSPEANAARRALLTDAVKTMVEKGELRP